MRILEVLWVFLRLGLTSFGGPVAHLSYFHDEFVTRRKWLEPHAYADLVALCQFLPGPASSQVGMAIGLKRAGYWGALAAWTGFTLPSALILILFALGVSKLDHNTFGSYLHGLKVVAVAVVAQAIWGMWKKICVDRPRIAIAMLAGILALLAPSTWGQVGAIISGGIAGFFLLRKMQPLPHTPLNLNLSKFVSLFLLVVFFILLAILPILSSLTTNTAVKQIDSFYRVGSLVFGGGHVVLPLLKAEVVNTGWVTSDAFMAGYGAAQAIPGPLFAFSAYLGTVSSALPSGVLGAVLCLLAAFLPSYLLVVGVLPFWEQLRNKQSMRFTIAGINAAVVGLLIAAFYDPVWTSAIFEVKDFSVAAVAFIFLVFRKTPSWLVVLLGALIFGLQSKF